jgi:hypothetical protein
MIHSGSPSIAVVALDAAEVSLIECYTAEGVMPTLASFAAHMTRAAATLL